METHTTTLTKEHLTRIQHKCITMHQQGIRFTLIVRWRAPVINVDEDELASQWLTWIATPKTVTPAGLLRVSFAEAKGYSDFPRDGVEYAEVKIARIATMPVDEEERVPQRRREETPQAQPPQAQPPQAPQPPTQGPPTQDMMTFFELVSNTKISAYKTVGKVKVLVDPGRSAIFYPHVWVEKLRYDSCGGVLAEWRMSVFEFFSRLDIHSDSIKMNIENAKKMFSEWLNAMLAITEDALEPFWRLGYRILENLLYIVGFALRHTKGMEKVRACIEEQWSKQTIDYTILLKEIEALTPERGPFAQSPPHYFRGRGRGHTDRGGRGYTDRGGRGRGTK